MSQKRKQTTDDSAAAIPSNRTTTRLRRAPKARIQNFVLVWLDATIDEVHNQDSINTISKLREIVNIVNTFINADECVNFITDVKEEEIFMIFSDAFGQTIVPLIHEIRQISLIYIFCDQKTCDEQWTKQWPKVKGVFTDIKPIYEALKQAIQMYEQNTISMSFVPPTTGTTNQNLNELDKSFMYTHILKEILLTIDFERQHINEFISYCREQFIGDMNKPAFIDKLEQEYEKHVPIWWYTFGCSFYSMLNRALRMMEVELIIDMGFFVRDLHKQITQLHSQQYAGHTHSDTFTVYRGLGLSHTDFEQLIRIKGGLLSFNNFLSTSMNRQISLTFALSNSEANDLVGILFVIQIDPSISSTPFANIRDVSYYEGEEEILFSMHSIFRIGQTKQIDGNDRLWQVDLTLTSDNDPQLHALTEYIREETFPEEKGWYRLGNLLIKLDQFDKAQQVYEVMLDQTADDHEKANIYHMLGVVKDNQETYAEAIILYQKSNEILQKILSPTHADMASSYNNIGMVYYKMGEYSEALSFFQQALKIYQKTLPADHSHLASSYNNIGSVYDDIGEYSKALSYYRKGLEISEKILPSNHPDLATSYDNIGLMYGEMGEYSKALSAGETALEIRQKTLPSNHPALAASHNNIGMVYYKMSEYSKALSFFQQALEIYQKTLTPNHRHLASSYSNIGSVYDEIGEYSKALSYYEKDLEILKKTLRSNHPDLATSYNNIGLIYGKVGEYSKAFSSHEKALEIRQKTLPSNHPSLAQSYGHIGMVSSKMGEHSKAVLYCAQALKIVEHSLHPDHPTIRLYKDNLEYVKKEM
ncbi:unnamed protein product [Rotaria sp. Silwood1]|nr:unnamed protein product [Rotaria sp. Silwood1]CAF1603667.1 unnamed protein product [Rotaria sp. Silwood1]